MAIDSTGAERQIADGAPIAGGGGEEDESVMNAIEATDAIETQPAWGAIKADLRFGIAWSCISGLFAQIMLYGYSHGSPEPMLIVASVFFLMVALSAREEISRKLGVVVLRDDEETRYAKESPHIMAAANKVRVVSSATGAMISSWLGVFSLSATLDNVIVFSAAHVANKGLSYESIWLGWKVVFGAVFVVWFTIVAVRNAKEARRAARRLLIYKPQPRVEG
jgi:hypothetical protein